MTPSSSSQTPRRWYVLRDLKRSNALNPAYRSLAQEARIEVFTPMHWCLKVRNGKSRREFQPVIQDLVFAYGSREDLDPIIAKTPTLQYRFERGGNYREPMFVATADMERFMRAVATTKAPRYYLPGELTPSMYGCTIRVVGGPLDGCEGRLLRIRGTRVKRLLLELPNFFTVGVEVAPEYVQIIESRK